MKCNTSEKTFLLAKYCYLEPASKIMHTYDLSKRRVTQTQHDKKPIEQCFRGCALNDSLVWNIITNNNQSNSFPITN